MKLYPRQNYEAYKKEFIPNKGKTNCPFCDKEKQTEYILWEGKYWKVIHNKFPFVGSSKHLLAMPIKCEKSTRNLSPEEWSEFGEVEKIIKKFYGNVKYYSFIGEEGNEKSVHHLHYHFLPGELPSHPFEIMMQEQGFEEKLDEE